MRVPDAQPSPATAPAQGSLGRNSLYKLVANGSRLLLGLVVGVMTARWLGPYDKGTLATLLFAGHGILFTIASLGLGDAATVLVGQGRFSIEEAVSGSTGLLLAACVPSAAALWVLALLADWSGISKAVVMTGIGMVLWVFQYFYVSILTIEERFLLSSIVTVVTVVVTAIATALLVGVMAKSITGAVTAAAIGLAAGLCVTMVALRRRGIGLRPRWNPEFAGPALRLGLGLQVSFLLIAMSQRLDQLVVFSLLNPSAAGRYSVALTVGVVVSFLPNALSAASFPRMARLPDDEINDFIGRSTRIGLAASIVSGVALIIVIPTAIPVVWGTAYSSASAPAMILVAGGAVWGMQWMLARSAAARGRPGLLIASFSVNVVVMLGLDLALITHLHLIGAAIASVAGSLAGLGTCLVDYSRRGSSASAFVPRMSDFKELGASVRRLASR